MWARLRRVWGRWRSRGANRSPVLASIDRLGHGGGSIHDLPSGTTRNGS
ncbi:MAG: hypothetical protein ABSF03_28910 [Streptosporangiaceae bacterium]